MTRSTRREFLKTSAAAGLLAASPRVVLPKLPLPSPKKPPPPPAKKPPAKECQVACYYFPGYHLGDPRLEKLKGKDWNEWELVKAAKPRFAGHQQPKVPLWGYTDEASPTDMAQKIDAAADHAIDAFLFDWYYYDNALFLDRGLEKGFLRAANNKRLKFALMWANHDWRDIFPYKLGAPKTPVFPGCITPAAFDKMCDYIIATYFKHPSYWLIEGCPYFSIYELTKLLDTFGSVLSTRAALDQFRVKTRLAGFHDLHLNAVVWGQTLLPGEGKPADPAELIEQLDFDSVTSYVWVHHVKLPNFPETEYEYVRDKYFEYWREAEEQFDAPYYPNVTMGWDSSPRANQADAYADKGYPFMATIGGNTPERFKATLEMTKMVLDKRPVPERILTINAWNEWTEGSYLEPDTTTELKYLEAIKSVFG
jgi:hypothetical protein